MSKRILFSSAQIILLIALLIFSFRIETAKAQATIYIRADGSIDPSTAPIASADNVTYVFTANIRSDGNGIVVQRNNIVIDGAAHTLQGLRIENSIGIDLRDRENVTVRNMRIAAFSFGIYLYQSLGNNVSRNNITANDIAVELGYSSNHNSLSDNNITANDVRGIDLYYSSNNNISGNKIANNHDGVILRMNSSDNSINGNNITANYNCGIKLGWSSNHNSIVGNIFMDCGLIVEYPNDYYGNVVADNSVNGKPLIYLQDVSDVTVDYAGQVILVNCTNIAVRNLNLSRTNAGVQLCKTSNTKISGNNLTANSEYDIRLINSSRNSIIRNYIASNGDGIILDSSSSNIITENHIGNGLAGIKLFSSSDNTVDGNDITADNEHGVSLYSSSGNSIIRNRIANSRAGIGLGFSSSNCISGNNITASNKYGVSLDHSSNYNTLDNNTITANEEQGIYVESSSCNSISRNNLVGNSHGINLYCSSDSNVSRNNITASMLDGILLEYSANNNIGRNRIANNGVGIGLTDSSRNSIDRNNILNSRYDGIDLFSSSNSITCNTIAASDYFGIWLSQASNNSITANNITANRNCGLRLVESFNNSFCHNNLDNSLQVYDWSWDDPPHLTSINVWDDGYPSGGNYWSDYDRIDTNYDGIGDTAYIIDANNTDQYPLMGMFHSYNALLPLLNSSYVVDLVSNSSISDFEALSSIEHPEEHVLIFNAIGERGTTGFSRVLIPTALMNDTFTVLINGTKEIPWKILPESNGTHRYLYFNYTHSTQAVMIVPEFPPLFVLPLAMILTFLAVYVYRARAKELGLDKE